MLTLTSIEPLALKGKPLSAETFESVYEGIRKLAEGPDSLPFAELSENPALPSLTGSRWLLTRHIGPGRIAPETVEISAFDTLNSSETTDTIARIAFHKFDFKRTAEFSGDVLLGAGSILINAECRDFERGYGGNGDLGFEITKFAEEIGLGAVWRLFRARGKETGQVLRVRANEAIGRGIGTALNRMRQESPLE